MNKGNKLYEGKAKIIYETKDKNLVIQHFKDDATAFNNLKKAKVEGKGVLNNRISEYILTNLSQCGIKTHLIKRLNMREQLIKKAEIFPVEFIVRNIATGSLTKRLGIPEGTVMDRPLLEYCLKNDDLNDPLISKDHIFSFGWATEQEIKVIDKMTLKINDLLLGMFRAIGIKLVDFKIEYGKTWNKDTEMREIVLADEISPDTCRLWDVNKDKKLKFLKTHNALCKIDNNIFTDKENTLGAIYIIRDPRNVISSISNHYDYNLKEALDFMKDEKRCLLDKEDERYLGFVPLFSWISHQKSWIKNKRFKVLTIKYEDLGSQTFKVFKEVIDFISSISNMKNAFNREKAKKVIQSCDFGKMQKLEKEKGFPEAVMKKNEDKKIKFFNLGPNNDYKNLLDKGILEEMNTIYKDQLEEFKYETKY